jgi:GMP synthase (glutamine-hydrolysing)
MKKALAIRHVAFEDLGSFACVLRQNTFDVTYVEAGLDDLAHVDPLAPDMLIILGGPIGAYEEHHYPFLTDELRLLERRLTADLPTLGICLGGQLMARALGARVYPGHCKEIGWSTLLLTAAGKRSPLRHLSDDQAAVLHWHGDTFALPEGATHLASTPLYENQAFSWGKRGLAVQFHSEVTVRGLERWLIGHACELGMTPGVSVAQLRQETTRYAPRLQAQAVLFWQAWLNEVVEPEPCLGECGSIMAHVHRGLPYRGDF